MNIERLYDIIISDLEETAINKFESKNEYLSWSQRFYDVHGFGAYGLSVPENDKIIKKYINQFKELAFQERLDLSSKFYTSNYITLTSFGLKLLELSLPDITQD